MPRKLYPLIPLKNIVPFPGIIVPLFVGRDKSLHALLSVMQKQKTPKKKVLFSLQKLGVQEPEPRDIRPIGVFADIESIQKVDKQTYKILVNGAVRVELNRIRLDKNYFVANFTEREDIDDFKSARSKAKAREELVKKLDEYLSLHRSIPADVIRRMIGHHELSQVINIIGHFLMFSLDEKQQLLELDSLQQRVRFVGDLISKEIEVLNLEDKLHSTVKENVEKSRKDFYLKEKIKAIQAELGDGEFAAYDEIDEYVQKVNDSGMSEEIKSKALRECSKLRKMSNFSAEAGIIKSYLEWLIEMPWTATTAPEMDMKAGSEILEKSHYGLSKVKERIIEFLGVYKRTGSVQGSILCIVGPSGVGKTSVAKAIAEAMGRPFVKISLGGLNDEAELRGHRRTYVGAQPGRVVQAIRSVKSRSPVVLLDEIDKLSSHFQSNPGAVLLEILDPEQNQQFYDYFMEVPFDLSDVVFIGTANSTYDISDPLLDRMEIIRLSGYSYEEKETIALDYLWPKLLEQHGLDREHVRIDPQAIGMLIRNYTQEAGLRQLERIMAAVLRKVVLETLEDDKVVTITESFISKNLGHPEVIIRENPKQLKVGQTIGLAYTQRGGTIMPIEVSVFQGQGKLILTGKMGEVMRESSQAALSFVRLRAKTMGLKKQFFEQHDIHIHIPENSIPKDGPSAGGAIAMALMSAFTGQRIKSNMAVTGELTLHGDILPVGGLREKLMAAEQHGIKKVLVPYKNIPEIKDMDDPFLKKISIIGVKTADDLVSRVFKKSPRVRKMKKKWLS